MRVAIYSPCALDKQRTGSMLYASDAAHQRKHQDFSVCARASGINCTFPVISANILARTSAGKRTLQRGEQVSWRPQAKRSSIG